VETGGQRIWEKLRIAYFSRVSERMLGIFGGLFCHLSGTKVGGDLLFWKRRKRIS
jgi:hypothetical protein